MSLESPKDQKENPATAWLVPSVIAVGLVFSIFALPRPSMISNQPWKSELVLLLILCGVRLFTRRRHNGGTRSYISLTILLFAAWGAISAVWAASPVSAVHHTMVWAVYLLAFEAVVSRDLKRTTVIRGLMIAGSMIFILAAIDFASIVDFRSVEGTLRIRYGRFGEMLATISPVLFAAGLAVRERRKRSLMLAAATAAWVGTMLSLSKGAFIAGVIGFGVFALLALIYGRARRQTVLVAVLFVAATAGTQAAFSALTSIPATADYISGKADTTRETSEFRVFTWRTARYMLREHWIAGAGADNFGIAFNEARAAAHAAAPQERTPEQAEDYLVERAHNEPLQIAAELGIIGMLLIASLAATFAVSVISGMRRRGWRLSPLAAGSLGGIAAFVVSSMFSSFSFRSVQNGVVFFFIMGLAAVSVTRGSRGYSERFRSRRTFAIAAVALIGAAIFGARGIAEILAYRAERTEDPSKAIRMLETARLLDPDYAGAALLAAGRAEASGDATEAARQMKLALDGGLGVTQTYMLLADFQERSGDITGAEATYREATRIFANSVFVRIRHAIFLEKQGRAAEAEAQKSFAAEIDPRQARGWYEMITKGSVIAFYNAKADPSIAEPNELKPQSAVPQYVKMLVPATE